MDNPYPYVPSGLGSRATRNLEMARHTMEGRPLPTEGALQGRMSNMSLGAHAEQQKTPASVDSQRWGPSPASIAAPLAPPAAVAVPASSPNPFETATQESKCFELGEAKVPSDNLWYPGSICEACSRLLTLAQYKNATMALRQLLPKTDCYICDMKALKPESFTKPFCRFLTDNPTIFHTVGYFKEQLNTADFKEV